MFFYLFCPLDTFPVLQYQMFSCVKILAVSYVFLLYQYQLFSHVAALAVSLCYSIGVGRGEGGGGGGGGAGPPII